jgi:hypothetical protein
MLRPSGDKIDENQLRRYSELMEDFRKENDAKTSPTPAGLPEPIATQKAVV